MTETTFEGKLDEAVSEILDEIGLTGQDRRLVEQIVETGIGLGGDGTSRLDLKISAAAIREMRRAFHLFAPYRGVPKVTIFGSARTAPHDPLSQQAEAVARGLAGKGWMVVTGAGPGIMEAGARGAGAERALGVSIQLPFEEKPNMMVEHEGRHVAMKYFFTRKLMLVKESRGFICLPGGFGTMDETFELLTLQQTGKMEPMPIVLLDRPGGTFWRGLERFITEELEASGMISGGDLDRVLITDDPDRAIAEVEGFWANYDSLRWVGDRLVLRLHHAPNESELIELNEHFDWLLREGRIETTEPLAPEVTDKDLLHLQRIVLIPQPRAVGGLHRLIRALNKLGPATAE